MPRELTHSEVVGLLPDGDEQHTPRLLRVPHGAGVAYTLEYQHYTALRSSCHRWWAAMLERVKECGWDADLVACATGRRDAPATQAGWVFRTRDSDSASIDVDALLARFVAAYVHVMNESWMDEQASHYGMSRDEWELSQWPDRD